MRLEKLHRGCWGLYSGGKRVAELSVPPKAALSLSLFEDDLSLNIAGSFFKVGKAWRSPDEIMESWGFAIHDDYLHMNFGKNSKLVEMPWAWVHDDKEFKYLCEDGVMRRAGGWKSGEKEPDPPNVRYWIAPYHYRGKHETQDVIATIKVETRVWRRKWAPFIYKSRTSIDVEFSAEVGDRAGSWKGGCIGCSYEIKKGESPIECLKRMEKERVFR